jgi:hypothetical protein
MLNDHRWCLLKISPIKIENYDEDKTPSLQQNKLSMQVGHSVYVCIIDEVWQIFHRAGDDFILEIPQLNHRLKLRPFGSQRSRGHT